MKNQKPKQQKALEFKRPICLMVSGKAGVGKTVSCLYIEDMFSDFGVRPYHFAHGVKKAAYDSFGWNGKKDSLGRSLLIGIGQTGRAYDESVWAKQLLNQVNEDVFSFTFDENNDIETTNIITVDDWRFPNEGNVLKGSGFMDVYTIRIHAPNREILKGTPQYRDVSETSLSDNPDDYDYFISNEGHFDILKSQIRSIVEDILTNKTEYFGG